MPLTPQTLGTLPIEPILPELRAALARSSAAVLQAPPGAGKTTLVPLALLDEPWLAGKKIVMLEPRRLAARAAATRMAELAAGGMFPLSTSVERRSGGEERQPGASRQISGGAGAAPSEAKRGSGGEVGGLIGYRIRRDTKVGRQTRIEVVTEGILTRILQHDPALEEYGLVIFDEFHERSLPGDLGLALTLQTQSLLRPELRILVMSATLDGEPVSRLLGGAPVVTSEGKSFPVETRWLPRRADQRIEGAMASAIRDALDKHDGDILAFLPGAAEIARTKSLLDGADVPATRPSPPTHLPPPVSRSTLDVIPLFGMLPQSEQDRALRVSPPGRRKVVLATSIAETSLTIDGVRVVIDSGLARVPRFSPASGMTRLATVRVSRASADQRRGRAGRTAPGSCYRLWAQAEEPGLIPRVTPEILEADLAPLALDLAAQGIADPNALRWLDPPPAAAFAEGRELLRELGALDDAGRITEHGRALAALPVHPRLAHMVVSAQGSALGGTACLLAALLEERDILRGDGRPPDADIELRLEALKGRGRGGTIHGHTVDGDAVRRAQVEAKALESLLGSRGVRKSAGAFGVRLNDRTERRALSPVHFSPSSLLALAYPDRVGRRREGQRGRFLLRNGIGAWTDSPSLIGAEWIVAAETDGDPREAKIHLGAALDQGEVEAAFGDAITTDEVLAWDAAMAVVTARRQRRLGAIVLSDAPWRDPDPALVAGILIETIRREGLDLLPWNDDVRALRQRLAFLHRLDASWPDVSDAALLGSLEEWAGPALLAVRKKGDLARLDLAGSLLTLLDWKRRQALDELAPARIEVPSGSLVGIDYADAEAPVLAVKLQEVFGWTATPTIGGGRVPLTLHLLSPARRPIQVTRDLASFWRSAYFEVRKDLRGRYPRHPWPEDPLSAPATKRTKKR